MTDKPDIELAKGLRAASNDCSGHEPSLSVLQRAADEAADRIERLSAALAARDTLWTTWLAREGISYDKGPDGLPKGWAGLVL